MHDADPREKSHEELLDLIDGRIFACRDKLAIEIRAMNDSLQHFGRAFPVIDGEIDIAGHRKFHDAKIKAAEAEAHFWDELRLDIAKKGTWGLLVIMVGLVLLGISVKFGFGAGLPR
jgi:hypothetical protein